MVIAMSIVRKLGTMVAYGYRGLDLSVDLALALRLGAELVEILPDWRAFPAPTDARRQVADAGLTVHSIHGCWGRQSIGQLKVDLGSTETKTQVASIDNVKTCIEWAQAVGGTCLVVHPGVSSPPVLREARRDALFAALKTLAGHARGSGVVLCVENMPPGVSPGSRMSDLASLIVDLAEPQIALALDTGHANIVAQAHDETAKAGQWLRTTHVHDNDGEYDTHLPPGMGFINWEAWRHSLDSIHYEGPIILECIRHLRSYPETITPAFLAHLNKLTGSDSVSS
ncbi:MAG: hypothetical protein NVSMB9_00460 [Isosphaeraceae bacterium]